jgi:hypothetical protein
MVKSTELDGALLALWTKTNANSMPSLPEHLASLSTVPAYAEATRHPFLVAAANGSLSSDRLAFWLSQDRIYASHAYPAFIGSLIATIPRDSSHGIYSREEQNNQHILSVMVYCLQNVVREVNFFKETAEQWGLPLDIWKERKGTKDYTAEMTRISKNGRMEDALIFLWAMERVSRLNVSGHKLIGILRSTLTLGHLLPISYNPAALNNLQLFTALPKAGVAASLSSLSTS